MKINKDRELRKKLEDAIQEVRDLICELSDAGWTHLHFRILVEHHHYQEDYIKISKVEDMEEDDE